MPRIPEAEIERLKRETDLGSLVRSRGIELKPHGSKDLAGKCPFHQEDTASFIVSPAKGLFHCMGCGVAGNCIQFVQKFDGVSFRHAFEILNAGKAFSASPTEPMKNATIPRLDNPFNDAATDTALLGQVVDYYHERLSKTPAALDYLRGRGLYDEACPLRREAIEKFRLGFADRTLGLRIPDANRKAGAAIRTRLQSLGLIRESGHEHFSGSVVLPIFSACGEVGEIYGRKITPNLRKGTPMHLYLQGPHEGIWNVEALDSPEIILCEAAFDALTFWVNGFKNVTFIYGTEGFTDELFDAILAHRVKQVRLAYDADEAGNRAAERDALRLTAQGVEVFRVKFPWGMDANEYAMKVQPPGKSLQVLLNAAEWLGEARHKVSEPQSDTRPGAPSSSILAANLVAKEKAAVAGNCEPLAELGQAGTVSALNGSACGGNRELSRRGEYYFADFGAREYRVGGLDKNNSLEVMKVAIRIRHGELFHLDSFDLTRDGERRRFIERAAEETRLEKELIKRDLGKLLLLLEQEQSARVAAALSPTGAPKAPEMTAEDRAEALAFLKSPDLVDKIGAAFETCGLVGEETNRLAAYLACTSRKLEKPLAIIIQSTTAAGKSTLMEAVLAMFPEEDRIKYSAMTGQSLYYLGETNLKHKILAIVEEEGAEKAGYALKLLQSEGELTIASTGKDPTTGRMETQEYHVEGPVMIFLTTTAVEIDEELLNRCLILTVDESREQTERIHTLQRKARTLEGLVAREEKKDLLRVLRNAQRLLQPLAVVNPFADELTFTAERTRTRRDHEKYLTLIDVIALLHQHQRTIETKAVQGRQVPFIRATLEDIELANNLAPELLGRSLDELPPQTRRVYEVIKAIIRKRCEAEKIEQRVAFFSRREIRSRLGWGITQIRAHLERLRELEYIEPRYGRMGSAFQYELITDCHETADKAHIGLLDVEKLRVQQATCREKKPLVGGCPAAAGQVQV
ncbi:MAG: CHC2 zinc finger domain-containing protein, partial [Kiritimatiellia bacterium]